MMADEMYADLAWLVKWGELSYGGLNILNDSGASEHIWQGAWSYSAPPEEECFVEYPIEVWVENNATFNSLSGLFGWNPEEKKPLKYRLNLVSGKGYAKAQQLEKLLRERPDVEVILYLSDFDPDGCNMPFAVRGALKWFNESWTNQRTKKGKPIEVPRYYSNHIKIEHIGIFPEQIPKSRRIANVKKMPKKASLKTWFVETYKTKDTYEIQALMPSEIRALVEKAIAKTI